MKGGCTGECPQTGASQNFNIRIEGRIFNSRSVQKTSVSLTLAGLASLAVGHVVEDVLHGTAVGQSAGPHLPIGLLPPLALVCMEQQDQLLLNEFALLGVGRRAR